MELWDYFRDNRGQIGDWTVTTAWLAVLPVAVGLVLALPVGYLASRYRWTYPPIVSGAGLLYTIPSLVLFLFLPSVLGTSILSPVNVAVGLTVYTFALLVRTVADGLNSAPADALAAASAMGYTSWQRLVSVQLPLAVPVIGAGVRVAAVSNVALISAASIIGVAQLGSLFVEGQTSDLIPPTVIGLILFVLMALVFDGLLLLVLRQLTPWRRSVRS